MIIKLEPSTGDYCYAVRKERKEAIQDLINSGALKYPKLEDGHLSWCSAQERPTDEFFEAWENQGIDIFA